MAFIYDLTDTWNAGGTTFNAIKMNVTDSASAAASKLVTLQVGGSERFGVRKDGQGYFAGNVGIGTSSPSAKLDVRYSNTAFAGGLLVVNEATTGQAWGRLDLRSANASDNFVLAQDQTGLSYVINSGAFPLTFGTSNTERLRITAAGNVGIGTSSPNVSLDVVGGIRARGGAPGGGGTSNNGYAFNGAGDTDSGMFSSADGQVEFYTNNSERVRITSTGNVGIGETAPDYKLDVNGSIGFTPGASVTPVDNGDVVFELTNNTTLTIKARGSDGVVRSGTITLA